MVRFGRPEQSKEEVRKNLSLGRVFAYVEVQPDPADVRLGLAYGVETAVGVVATAHQVGGVLAGRLSALQGNYA